MRISLFFGLAILFVSLISSCEQDTIAPWKKDSRIEDIQGIWLNDDKICLIQSFFSWESDPDSSGKIYFEHRAYCEPWDNALEAEINISVQPLLFAGSFSDSDKAKGITGRNLSFIKLFFETYPLDVLNAIIKVKRKQVISNDRIKRFNVNKFEISNLGIAVISIDILLDVGDMIHIRYKGPVLPSGKLNSSEVLFAVDI